MTKEQQEQLFAVYEISGFGWHWEGINDYDEYCSEDGFRTEQEAINDALEFLKTVEF